MFFMDVTGVLPQQAERVERIRQPEVMPSPSLGYSFTSGRATRLRADTRLAAWLFTVARHLYISYLRSRMLEDSVVSGLMALWPVSPPRASPFETAAATELERRIERALTALPLASREVLLLVGVAELDHSDAADVCGITPAALRQRLHRAREALAIALEREERAKAVGWGDTKSCPTR
jgi:RNA polymerase sigma factor (sigma-70 family)